MDTLRNTLSLQSVKTRQIVYQNPDGSFPAVGAVLNVTDTQGHTDWTRDLSVNSVTLVNNISGPGRLTYSNTGVLLLNGVPVGGGGGVTGGDNITVVGNVVNLDIKKDISMNKYEINDCKGISIVNQFGFGTPGRISNIGTDLNIDKPVVVTGTTFGRLILKGASAPPDQASLTYMDATDTLFVAARNIDLTAVSSGGGVGKLNINAELDLCGNPGTMGQVLTSQGPGVQPIWSSSSGLVTSVTAGPSGNITVAPNTGDVIVDLCRNIILSSPPVYVAVGDNVGGATIRYSFDGLTWNNATNAFTTYGNGVTYSNGLWVAVGEDSGGKTIKCSTDGITWINAVSGAFTNIGRGIAYGNGQWVAVGDGSGNTIKYSSDALNWTNAINSFRVDFQLTGGYGVAYGGGSNWVAVGHDIVSSPNPGKNIKYSSDNGVSWSNALSNTFTETQRSYGYGIHYGNGRFIALGFDPNATNNTIKYSTDNGANWTNSLTGGFDYAGRAAAFDGIGKWLAVGQDSSGNTIRISADNGVNWTNATSGAFGNYARDVMYANSKWFAVGDMTGSTSTIKYSSDGGLTWSNAVSGAFSVSGRGIAGGPLVSPSIQFKSGSDTVGFSISGPGQLVVLGSAGATTQIATPLRDVATGGPGVAGQVLTSQGVGLPPVWAAGGGGGGVVLASNTYLYAGSPYTVTINAATFPGIPTTSPTTIRIYSQAGGGGGGGGWGLANAGGIQSGGGGGGGGAGYVQDFFLSVPYGTQFILTIGNGGNGGGGGNIFGPAATDGQVGGANTIAATVGVESLSYVTPGGAGGINGGGSGAGGGGDPAGDTAPVYVTGPFGGYNPGAKGGGLYGGTAGAGDGSIALGLRNAGRGLPGPAHYSGAGGGGGGGGQGSNGEAGGAGAAGFIRIDVYSG